MTDTALSREDFESICTQLEQADSHQLKQFAGLIAELQREAALAAGDVDAIIADAFERGFTASGAARDPWMDPSGLLVIPGVKLDKSGMNHVCSFAQVGGKWSWESSEKVHDEVRPGALHGKTILRTVTVCTAWDGLEVDRLESATQMGVHQLKKSTSWVVRDGDLVMVQTRTRSNQHSNR